MAKTKITHTYTVEYTEAVTYQEIIEAENKQKAEEIFLKKLGNNEFEPVETNCDYIEVSEDE